MGEEPSLGELQARCHRCPRSTNFLKLLKDKAKDSLKSPHTALTLLLRRTLPERSLNALTTAKKTKRQKEKDA